MPLAELLALLHLASPALPIGGFSYSQGFEAAIEAGFVTDEETARRWIQDGLETVLGRCELPFIAQQMARWDALGERRCADDRHAIDLANANHWYLASRESSELRQETEQMGWSLASLCTSLSWGDAEDRAVLSAMKPVALPTVYAFVTTAHRATVEASLAAYAFNWVENQVAAALKSVPLGQLSGQRILYALREPIAAVVPRAMAVTPDALSTFSPLLGILSARHESQYSRLFRS